MDLAAVVLSGLSLVIAVVGTALANKRSKEALDESRRAAASALWADVQQAVQRFIGFDPRAELIGDRLINFRVATIALIDELDGWPGFDRWLDTERVLGTVLGRQVFELASRDDTVDQRLAILDPYQRWALVLSQNLRRFRKIGFDARVVQELHASAKSQINAVCETHGWPLPPEVITGVEPIDPDARTP